MSVCRKVINNNNEESCDYKLYKYLGDTLPVIGSLDDLVKELNLIFESDTVNIELVSYVMKSYKSNPMDWKKYAKFNRYR